MTADSAPTGPKVGFSGLGRMGRPMATHLAAGFDLTVHNRTGARAEAFAAATGAGVAGTPRQLGERCSIVVTMVADGPALLELVEGPDGLAAGLSPGAVVVDMGTTGMEHTHLARRRLGDVGVELVEAPVSGSTAAAEGRTMLIMAAGAPAAIDTAMPVLETLSGKVMRVGGPGAGAAMKLAVNSVLYAINEALSESLVLAERVGIDRSVAYDVFAASSVAAPVVHYRRAVFEDPAGTPVSFAMRLAVKDLDLVLGLAADVGAPMPQAEVNRTVAAEAVAAGLGEADLGQVAVHLRGGP